MNEDRNVPPRDEGQRAALGDLGGKGKHHSVGPSRIGSARAGTAIAFIKSLFRFDIYFD